MPNVIEKSFFSIFHYKGNQTQPASCSRCLCIFSMVEVGVNQVHMSAPAQTMSLLANEGGFHIIATSSRPVQARLLHNMEETLAKGLYVSNIGSAKKPST